MIKQFGKEFLRTIVLVHRYTGNKASLVTTDLDILKSVLVKNFDSFSDVTDLHVRIDFKITKLESLLSCFRSQASSTPWRSLLENLGEISEKI